MTRGKTIRGSSPGALDANKATGDDQLEAVAPWPRGALVGDLDVLRRGSPWDLQRQPHRRPRPLHANGVPTLYILRTRAAPEAIGRGLIKMIAGSWQDS